ncbi:MAG: hypothetical protein CL872_07025 [Dehalococcoidaceae bacterium]|nr:hypothetical protein [Dehalococcoidaceae bacterium]MBR74668.1 hypothetical protein [Dehalococcoidaceae bacterium]|tara:strand:+ start:2036 stop:2350 length:315 start_codon:yes stop_codon:yes gene_type:complete
MRRHVYNFKFKEGTSEEKIQEIIDAFQAEYNANEGMTHFSIGQNISESKRPKRFDWIMTMDFVNYKSFREYEDSPKHHDIKNLLHPVLEDIMGTDYDIGSTPAE